MNTKSSLGLRRTLFHFLALTFLGLIWLTGSQSSVHAETAPLTDFNLYLAKTSFEPRQYVPATPTGLTYSAAEAAASGVYLVQFTGPVVDTWKDQLIAAGAQLGPYIPNYAFIVRMDPDSLAAVQALPFVRWTGIYQPAYKLASNIDPANPRLYKVTLAPWANTRQMQTFSTSLNAPAQIYPESMVILLDPSQVNLLAHQPDAIWIEPYYINQAYNNVAGGTVMNGATAWSNGYTGAGVTIAVADTGLDTGDPATMHLDFMNGGTPRVTHISSWAVPSLNLGAGCYVTNAGADDGADDVDSGHGTHVTGSVAGNGAQSSGLYKGLAYNANITFQAVEQYVTWSAPCPSYGITNGYYLVGIPDDVRSLLSEVYDWGARIQNDSWGGGTAGVYDQQASYFDDFTFNHQDFTVVVAAGNDGKDANHDGYVDNGSVTSPATAKNVIAVGATENNRPSGSCNVFGYNGYTGCTYNYLWGSTFGYNPTSSDIISDNIGHMAAFSSRGPAADGRIRPDVVAPGTDIISTHSSQTSEYGWGPLSGNGYYEYMGGTSMASPLTAGAAALVRQFLISHEGLADPSAALIKADLINTAVDIPGYGNSSYEAGAPIPNNSEGWGRVDVGAATTSGRIFLDGATLSTGASFDADYMVNAGTSLKVTLAWSDYPAAPAAGVTLVNDLNLRLTAPDGSTTYWGNAFSGGWSATGGSADNRNNVENVYIQSPATGLWRVEVIGQNVPNGPQPYALVLAGNIVPPANFNKSTPDNGATAQSITPTLSWESSTGAASYEYCIDQISDSFCNGTGAWTSTAKNTSVSLSALSYNTTYYWQVRAWNGRGYTYANSGVWWSFTTEINPSQPEIEVEGPGPVSISDGGVYGLGTTEVGTPISRTITVRNAGNIVLNLLTNPPTTTGNFTASTFGSTALAPGGSTTFELTCTATSAGAPVSGTVSFGNNDENENPFNFTVTCTVNPSLAPEIVVEGPGPTNIPDGGSFDLGTTIQGAPLTQTITVRNTGMAALTLLTNPPATTGDFSATTFEATSVAAGASTTFDATCEATTPDSPATGTISFGNNDSDENPFNFTVTCTVLEPVSLIVNNLADTNDGTCSPADCTLREAVEAANTYPGADMITFAVDGTIALDSSLPAIASELTIDGQGRTVAISGGHAVRLLWVNYGASLTLDTLTLQDGSADYGGAVKNAGVLVIRHSTLTGNHASNRGGAIDNSRDLTITDSTISNNSTTYSHGQTTLYQGGGIANQYSLTVTGSTITGNTANYGGGIYNGANLTLSQSTVSGNLAGQGSGIWNESAAVISDSSIIDNQYAFFDGGGIDNYYATLEMSNSYVSGNSSGFGGGIRMIGGSLTLRESTLSDNFTDTGPGGAIDISHNGVVTAENSTFSQNSAGSGGGAVEVGYGSVLTATQVTFSGNAASSGVSLSIIPAWDVNPAGTVYLAGSILEAEGGQSNCSGAVVDNGYNVADDASCGLTGAGSLSNATLDLSTLADHGGPTLTHLPGTDSAAIDLIPNGITVFNQDVSYTCGPSSEPLDEDQRGSARPAATTGRCDAGAVEAGDRPGAPVLLSPANGSTGGSNTPTFIWGSVTGAAQYQLQVDDNAGFSSPEIDKTLEASAFTPGSVLPNGAYHWRVRASNGLWSPYSGDWTVNLNSLSTNANLSNLVLSTGSFTPAFDPSTTTYTQSVSNAVTTVSVTPSVAHTGAGVTVNGSPVASGIPSDLINLGVGPNTITIVVTAEDGVTTKTYTVTVTRSPSSNARLSNLVLSSGPLTPAFDPYYGVYVQSVDNLTSSLTVTPTAADPGASISVNGSPVVSGTASTPIGLDVGTNTIAVFVEAADGITNNTYWITVTRPSSSNANLNNLTLSSGPITPEFNPATTAYSQTVSNAVDDLTVTPTAAEATATLTVNGISVASGNASGPISLNPGLNTITIVVTAGDGTTTKTYTIAVTRTDLHRLFLPLIVR